MISNQLLYFDKMDQSVVIIDSLTAQNKHRNNNLK